MTTISIKSYYKLIKLLVLFIFFSFISLQRTWKCNDCDAKGAGEKSKTKHQNNHVDALYDNYVGKLKQKEDQLQSIQKEKMAIFKDIDELTQLTITRIKSIQKPQ